MLVEGLFNSFSSCAEVGKISHGCQCRGGGWQGRGAAAGAGVLQRHWRHGAGAGRVETPSAATLPSPQVELAAPVQHCALDAVAAAHGREMQVLRAFDISQVANAVYRHNFPATPVTHRHIGW